MRKKILAYATALFISGQLLHAQTITLMIEGAKQGKFKAESNRSKFEGKSELIGFLQEIVSPRDPASGAATGKTSYQPVTLLKQSGASSPQIFQAMITNELLKKVNIDFYKTDQTGQEVNYYSITLENVSVSGYKQFIGPLDNEKFNPANNILFDEIKLVFQKITVEEKIVKTIAVADQVSGRF